MLWCTTYNNTLIEGSKRNYVKQTPPRRRASFVYINSSILTCETSQPSVSSIDWFLVSPYIRSPRFILLAGKDSTRFWRSWLFLLILARKDAPFFFPFPVLFWPFLGQSFCPRELLSWGHSVVAGAGMGARGGWGQWPSACRAEERRERRRRFVEHLAGVQDSGWRMAWLVVARAQGFRSVSQQTAGWVRMVRFSESFRGEELTESESSELKPEEKIGSWLLTGVQNGRVGAGYSISSCFVLLLTSSHRGRINNNFKLLFLLVSDMVLVFSSEERIMACAASSVKGSLNVGGAKAFSNNLFRDYLKSSVSYPVSEISSPIRAQHVAYGSNLIVRGSKSRDFSSKLASTNGSSKISGMILLEKFNFIFVYAITFQTLFLHFKIC